MRYHLTIFCENETIEFASYNKKKDAINDAIVIKRTGTISRSLSELKGWFVSVYDSKIDIKVYEHRINRK